MATEKTDTLQRIELAEGVEIRLRTAGPFVRAAAWLVDLGLQVCILVLLAIFGGMLLEGIGFNVAFGFFLISAFVLFWFYNVYYELRRNGATPGKRMMGLRVVQPSGIPVRLTHSVVRNFVRLVDCLPVLPLVSPNVSMGDPFVLPTYGLGIAVCLFTRNFQRLGDLAAGTVVIYAKPYEMHSPGLREEIPFIRPMHPLAREEQQAAVMFLERAPMFSDSRKEELADHAEPLTGETGSEGVRTLMGVGAWVRDSG